MMEPQKPIVARGTVLPGGEVVDRIRKDGVQLEDGHVVPFQVIEQLVLEKQHG